MRKSIVALTVLALGLGLGVASAAGGTAGKRQVVDSYCSPTGDYCTAITVSRTGKVKFALSSLAFGGEYTICVKGPGGKECEEFELEPKGGEHRDRVSWQRNFPSETGTHKVIWKLGGAKLGKPLFFLVEPVNPRG